MYVYFLEQIKNFMACTPKKNIVAVQDMFEGEAPDRTIARALNDAEIFIEKYGSSYTDDSHTVLLRYYACHLLATWGFAARVTSMSVGGVSETREALGLTEKENVTSYLYEFSKLLQSQTDEFFISA